MTWTQWGTWSSFSLIHKHLFTLRLHFLWILSPLTLLSHGLIWGFMFVSTTMSQVISSIPVTLCLKHPSLLHLFSQCCRTANLTQISDRHMSAYLHPKPWQTSNSGQVLSPLLSGQYTPVPEAAALREAVSKPQYWHTWQTWFCYTGRYWLEKTYVFKHLMLISIYKAI